MREVYDALGRALASSKCALLIGPPGSGKTHAIYQVAKSKGFNVVEIDAIDLDLEAFTKQIALKPLVPTVFVIDIVDVLGLREQKRLTKVLRNAVNPVVLTAYNKYRVADDFAVVCEVVMVRRPLVQELLKVANAKAQELRLKPNLNALNSRDYRQAVLSVYGSEGYEVEPSILPIVERYFRTGEIDTVDPNVLATIVDNVGKLYGIHAYLLLKSVATADLARRPEPLQLPELKGKVTSVSQSYFLAKLKLARGLGVE
jgi:hypothetical protein